MAKLTGYISPGQIPGGDKEDTLDAVFNLPGTADGTPVEYTFKPESGNTVCYGFGTSQSGGRKLNVTLPVDVTTIGPSAFGNNAYIGNVTAPGVTDIKSGAFSGCNGVSELSFPAVQTIRQNSFANIDIVSGGDKTLRFATLSTIEAYAFAFSSAIEHVYIGYDGVCTLENKNAFTLSSGLIAVHVPSEHLSEYEGDTNWAAAVADGYITLAGDYE